MHVSSVASFSWIQLFATALTVACQVPLSVGFSRQEYWRELPFPPPGDLPDPGTEPVSPVSCFAGGFFTTEPRGEALCVDQEEDKNPSQYCICVFLCMLIYSFIFGCAESSLLLEVSSSCGRQGLFLAAASLVAEEGSRAHRLQ